MPSLASPDRSLKLAQSTMRVVSVALLLLAVLLPQLGGASSPGTAVNNDASSQDGFLFDVLQSSTSGAKATLSAARPTYAAPRTTHTACLKAATLCDPRGERSSDNEDFV